jgi:2-polyprenyl-3-methyl-5-hydroxy-6-metoxy-1,4-benzoquinol methylase
MKKIIQNIVPAPLLRWYKAITMRFSRFKNMDTKEVFTIIYNTNDWKSQESISGIGSEIKQTESLIKDLGKLLKDLNTTSLLDIPCGDFKWMQEVDLSGIHYTGADIVEELIEKNKKDHKYKSNIEFKVLDLINGPLPKNDLIIVRDCFVHLSFADIFKALENIRSSGCKYLLTTTFPEHRVNYNIATGEWRTINLVKKPFNFQPPLLVINENCTEYNGRYKDKSMALWEVSKI